jgi:hypothetical protein
MEYVILCPTIVTERGLHNQQAFLLVLALTLLIKLFIFIYLSLLLRVRLITDLCEPLVLFVLGYHSAPSEGLFKGLPQEGPQRADLGREWIVKRKNDQLVVVGKEEADGKDGEGRGWFKLRRRRGGMGDTKPLRENGDRE